MSLMMVFLPDHIIGSTFEIYFSGFVEESDIAAVGESFIVKQIGRLLRFTKIALSLQKSGGIYEEVST